MLAEQRKLFISAKLIKPRLTAAAQEFHPEKINSFKIISLSPRMVVQRAEDIERSINRTFKDKTNGSKCFALALDEPTAVNNIGQFLNI